MGIAALNPSYLASMHGVDFPRAPACRSSIGLAHRSRVATPEETISSFKPNMLRGAA